MSENKLKAGLIGYGLAGKVFHAPLLAGSGFELTSILTNNPDRIASAKSDFPNAHIAEDMKQLLDQELDLVVVASANVVHAEQALQVIAAGITVVIDKPVGRNVRETHSIFDAADNAGVKACAFFNRRWDSDALTMKRVIKSREIGSIHRFESRFERFRPEIKMDSWREDSAIEQGGGLLLDLQTHLIAGAIDLFGPAEVSYCSMRKIRGGSEDDSLLTLIGNKIFTFIGKVFFADQSFPASLSVSEITKVGLLTSLSNSLNCGGTKQIKSATRERKRERERVSV